MEIHEQVILPTANVDDTEDERGAASATAGHRVRFGKPRRVSRDRGLPSGGLRPKAGPVATRTWITESLRPDGGGGRRQTRTWNSDRKIIHSSARPGGGFLNEGHSVALPVELRLPGVPPIKPGGDSVVPRGGRRFSALTVRLSSYS